MKAGRGSPVDEAVLGALRRKTGHHQTVHCLGERLGLSPQSVTAAIRELHRQGYEIEAHPGLGYRLLAAPDRLSRLEIGPVLRTRFMGRPVYSYGSVRSTNRVALELSRKGAPEGTLVLAEEQLAGRGRLGRTWHSPPGLGLWMSLILHPRVPADRVFQVAICGALAVAETVSDRFPLDVKVKWPNDVLIGGAKLAGVLVESQWNGPDARGVVVGIGINVNHRASDFPRHLHHRATSLRMELGRAVDRTGLLGDLLACFENIYLQFHDQGLEPFLDRWRQLSAVLGQPIRIQIGRQTVRGLAAGIDAQGALLLTEENGDRHRFLAGDVSVTKIGTTEKFSSSRTPTGDKLSQGRRTCGL